ncbi:ESX secretion-associated protein EspG [Nocardia sp. N2S4-5]|uniref:ESX secretion-associated protein EspG n=1 Tax=Nocardia sp. N2S4-5 TaxID=3351565 RepID=UPI0037CDC1C3
MKTQTSWSFTPDEFAYVWSTETGLEGDYPHPISIVETPTTATEYEQLRAQISARYPRYGDPDLTGPLRLLANPDLRIICNGWFHEEDRRVRSHAAAAGDLGVILYQKPGRTMDFGGDIKLVVTSRHLLGKHVAATMPSVPAGALGRLAGYTPRVRGEEPPSSWLRNDVGQRPVEERIRLLLRVPRTAQGYLRVDRGLHARRPHPSAYISWIDVSGNTRAGGRYVIEVTDSDTIVTGASAEDIAREIQRRVGPE